jgi:hypothetical protein
VNAKIPGLVTLIDEAISMAEERLLNLRAGKPDPSTPGGLERIILGLRYRRDEAVSGKLDSSDGSGSLGLARAAGEYDHWGTDLMGKIGEIEKYYGEALY